MRYQIPFFRVFLIVIFALMIGFTANADEPSYLETAAERNGYPGYTVDKNISNNNDDGQIRLSDPQGFSTAPILNQQFIQTSEPTDKEFKRKDDKEDFSRLEVFYQSRTNDKKLSQYGYDLFYTNEKSYHSNQIQSDNNDDDLTSPSGAVQDDYIVQAGDEITIILSGEKRTREVVKVSSDGRLIIDGFAPISAAGRTMSDIKNSFSNELKLSRYYGDIDISVSAIRQIGVLVAGQVYKPGRHSMNNFHSVLDALNESGGVRKTGSLRSIKLIRQGETYVIDLYDYIVFQRASQAMALKDGDRIIVPPVGPTMAVVGDVKQAGIFELKSQFKKPKPLTLNEAMTMAGGILGGGDVRFSLMQANGKIIDLIKTKDALIDDGAILTVTRAADRLANAIELKGYSRQNGIYDLNSAGTLTQLMGDLRIFGDDTYPLIGVISRVQRQSLTQNIMGFSPQMIANGQDDRQLEAGDSVYLFSNADIQNFINNDSKSNNNNEKNQFPQVVVDYVLDQSVTVQGAVRNEGRWPVGSITDLKTLISVAGGLTANGTDSDIEITAQQGDKNTPHTRQRVNLKDMKASEIMISAGDQVRVNEQFKQAVAKTVKISGEVKYPGSYDLMRGDKLSSLIERAGGVTLDAYPPAAVFSRQAERKREEQKFRAAAQELERTVSVNLNAQDKDAALTPAQISMARKLADDLRAIQAVGRVTVEADPVALSVRPELDMLLEDGDHLYIPKRNLTVRVSGEVMNPANLLFDDKKSVSDYLNEAGGVSYFADKDRMFVVYPDGAAQPVNGSLISGKSAMIIPGSTIIIPRDPKPFDFMDSFKDITQILTNMAITGVFIEDIATDEN